MSALSDRLTLTEVAKHAGVGLSAVSNWRRRHSDFPSPRADAGQDLFEVGQVAQWLQGRRIPKNALKPDERPGVSYGDRFLGSLGISVASVGGALPEEAAWRRQLRSVMDRLRGEHDATASVGLVLALLFVRTREVELWKALVRERSWDEVRRMLAGVELSMAPEVPAVPLFGMIGQAATVDQPLIDVIRMVDAIELGDVVGFDSIPAQICDTVLSYAERDMGKSGGQFTPDSIARCMLGILDPEPSAQVYDPFCMSGELLSAAVGYVRGQGAGGGPVLYGQAPHERAWLTTKLNLVLHDAEQVSELGMPAVALQKDAFPGKYFDRILTNPPFNIKYESVLPPSGGDGWRFGKPPARNANFAWLQHVVAKLGPGGRAAVIMPNVATFVQSEPEVTIRGGMVDAGVVDCVIALPPGLFRFTGVPVTLWVLRGQGGPSCASEVLFIDAMHMGTMLDRSQRTLAVDETERIVMEYRNWYERHSTGDALGSDGFARSVGYDEIQQNDYNLSPRRYTTPAVPSTKTSQVADEFDTLRTSLAELRERANGVRGTFDERLAAVVAGRWFDPSSAGGWTGHLLGEVCDVLAGPGAVSRSGSEPLWTPLVLPRNIQQNFISKKDLDVVPPAVATKLARYELFSGDIVSVRAGTLGRFARVQDEQAGWLLGPGCIRLRPNERADADYLTYYLGSPVGRQWLLGHAEGSAIQSVSSRTLRDMPLVLPALSVQREVVAALQVFDTEASIHERIGAVTRQLQETVLLTMMTPPDRGRLT